MTQSMNLRQYFSIAVVLLAVCCLTGCTAGRQLLDETLADQHGYQIVMTQGGENISYVSGTGTAEYPQVRRVDDALRLEASRVSAGRQYDMVITVAAGAPALQTDYPAELQYSVPASGVTHSSRGTVRFSVWTAERAEGSFSGPSSGGWISGTFRVAVH